MIELPDDELDKLFKKSTEELDPNYEPADWNALRKRLDQQDGTGPSSWLQKWWPLGILLLLLPVGIYLGMKGTDVPLANRSMSGSEFGSKVEVKRRLDKEPSTDHGLESGKEKEFIQDKKNDSERVNDGILNNKVTELPHELKREVTQANEKISDIGKKPKVNGVDEKFVKIDREEVGEKEIKQRIDSVKGAHEGENLVDIDASYKIGQKSILGEQEDRELWKVESSRSEGQVGEITAGIDQTNTVERLVLDVRELEKLSYTKNKNMSLPAIEKVQEVTEEKLDMSRDISPKMAIRFGYSPDLSTVGLKDFSKPGTAVSLLVEYALQPRLYFQTGVVRSEKVYWARASAYELSKYVTAINTPYSVDGTCSMYEIPVGIRYDLRQTNRSRIFAGVGAASYYVQKEKYTYNYTEYVHGQAPGWKGKTGWFWLSHLTASVGYEHRISNKLSLLAEPYIRVPLKGVGYGKVNLVTTGLWLSLRYTPAFYKK